jgi:hypothetical protein
MVKIANEHNIKKNIVYYLRHRLVECGGDVEEAAKDRLYRAGARKTYTADMLNEMIARVPLEERKTLRKLSKAIGVSMTTLSKHVRATNMQPHVFSRRVREPDNNKVGNDNEEDSEEEEEEDDDDEREEYDEEYQQSEEYSD